MQLPRKMSAHNVMVSLSRSLDTHQVEGRPSNEVKFAGEESKDRLYEPKHKLKLVRVLTVLAYMISVSLAAIVLSLYYMYIWDPSDHPHYVLNQKSTESNSEKTPCLDPSLPGASSDGHPDGILESYEMLTSRAMEDSSMPTISSVLFQALSDSEDYRDGTIPPGPELADD